MRKLGSRDQSSEATGTPKSQNSTVSVLVARTDRPSPRSIVRNRRMRWSSTQTVNSSEPAVTNATRQVVQRDPLVAGPAGRGRALQFAERVQRVVAPEPDGAGAHSGGRAAHRTGRRSGGRRPAPGRSRRSRRGSGRAARLDEARAELVQELLADLGRAGLGRDPFPGRLGGPPGRAGRPGPDDGAGDGAGGDRVPAPACGRDPWSLGVPPARPHAPRRTIAS